MPAVESRECVQFVLRGCNHDPAIAVLLGPFDLGIVHGNVFLAKAKKAADTDNDGFDFAFLPDDKFIHVADLLRVVSGAIVDRLADQIAGELTFSRSDGGSHLFRRRGGGIGRSWCLRLGERTRRNERRYRSGSQEIADHLPSPCAYIFRALSRLSEPSQRKSWRGF